MSASSQKDRAAMALEAEARRLLRALAAEGAWGFDDTEGAKPRIAVAAPRGRVSVRVATHSAASATILCGAGLAVWDGAAKRKLALTDTGKARAARDAASGGLNPFLAQHKPTVRRAADNSPDAAQVIHDQEESPIAWLATRKDGNGRPLISASALEAGERLRRDLTFAQILPRVTADWTANAAARGYSGETLHFSEMAIAARQRVEQALSAAGPEFAGLLVDVCGFLKGLELVETERGWPRRSAKVVLALALHQLCRHYGIAEQAVGPERSRGLRHWGAEDFRPALNAGAPSG